MLTFSLEKFSSIAKTSQRSLLIEVSGVGFEKVRAEIQA